MDNRKKLFETKILFLLKRGEYNSNQIFQHFNKTGIEEGHSLQNHSIVRCLHS